MTIIEQHAVVQEAIASVALDGETQSVGSSNLFACDICGQSETKAGSPFNARTLGLHKRQQHKVQGASYESNQRYARTKNAPKPDVLKCEVCGETKQKNGKPFTANSLGLHMRFSHKVQGKWTDNNRTETRRGHDSRKKNGELVHLPRPEQTVDVTTLDITLAVLGKVSPDGRIAVADLPEVLTWIEHTHNVVERVSGR